MNLRDHFFEIFLTEKITWEIPEKNRTIYGTMIFNKIH